MGPSCWQCGENAKTPDSSPEPEAAVTPPGLARLLTSNDAPLDSEVPSIHDIISTEEDRIDALDMQIEDMEATIYELEIKQVQLVRRRNDAKERIRKHSTILSPIRRVPPELIFEIFAFAVIHDNKATSETQNSTRIWHITHVCRTWRLVALSDRSLWRFITIERSSFSEAIEAQLVRSANLPLDICWRGHPIDRRCIDLIISHCSRWETVTLRFDVHHSWCLTFKSLSPTAGASLEQLKRLKISNPGSRFPSILPDSFLLAPNLREVTFDAEVDLSDAPAAAFVWHQLTVYRGICTVERQLNVLQVASNLQECALSFTNRAFGRTTIASLPRLRRLRLAESRFLRNLNTPALEELVLEVSDMSDITPFLHRTTCSLTNLVLMECILVPAAELTAILQRLPSLTHLFLETCPLGSKDAWNNLLETLLISGAPISDLCPNLTSLVYGFRQHHLSLDILFAMVQSRPPVQLQSLRDAGLDAGFLRLSEVLLLKQRLGR
ncbi:hypothetical protein C8R46DRAFT_1344465 [Mycena filopes]|nr:hypothetical protein C8R46DRAFT_1344465 [Mycena filopes]